MSGILNDLLFTTLLYILGVFLLVWCIFIGFKLLLKSLFGGNENEKIYKKSI